MTPALTFRPATLPDYDTIARLHALSWQHTYRGMMRDDYLDGEVVEERLAVWQERLSQDDPRRLVLLAERDGVCVGFVCALLDHDPIWGDFIDNLHVRPDLKGSGIGARLMLEATGWFKQARPGGPFYLWVLEDNHGARRFYERLGATNQERVVRATPFSPESRELRYCWANAAAIEAFFEQP